MEIVIQQQAAFADGSRVWNLYFSDPLGCQQVKLHLTAQSLQEAEEVANNLHTILSHNVVDDVEVRIR